MDRTDTHVNQDRALQELARNLLELSIGGSRSSFPLPAASEGEKAQQSVGETVKRVSEWLPAFGSHGGPSSSTALNSILGSALGGGGMAQALGGDSGGNWLRWISPLAGLFSLFSRGGAEESTEPAAVEAWYPNRGTTYLRGVNRRGRSELTPIDYGADGQPRAQESRQAPANVVIQVQAIDSRSFLDYQDEIAEAVRKSLLESHSLSDTLREI